MYASCGERRPPRARAAAAALREVDFPALKLRCAVDPRDDLAVVRAVREALAPPASWWTPTRAGECPGTPRRPGISRRRCGWPTRWPSWASTGSRSRCTADYRGLANLRRRARLRIAGGEGNREYSELREYLRHGSLDVCGPTWCGAPACCARPPAGRRGPGRRGDLLAAHLGHDGLVLLANLHICAAVSTAPFVERYDPPGWTPRAPRLHPAPRPILPDATATIELADAPGLGVAIGWDALEPLRVHVGTME